MRASELELETLLLHLLPSRAQTWQGATPAEIDQLEQLAGRPLPSLYRWFLSRMGRSSGLKGYPSFDFSPKQILSCYASDEVDPDPRLFLIGWNSDDYLPRHLFYDFDHATEEDARVVLQPSVYDTPNSISGSLRILLATTEFWISRVQSLPQQCSGYFKLEDLRAFAPLDQVMTQLGFHKPVANDSFAAIYDREDAAMSLTSDPSETPCKYLFFNFGGPNADTLNQVLSTLTTELKLKLKLQQWRPPL